MKNANYTAPEIVRIELDAEISLQLSSDPNPDEEPVDWVMNNDSIVADNPFKV
jgi:hypothetical protein